MITHMIRIVLKFKQMAHLQSEAMSERPDNCKGALAFVDTDIVYIGTSDSCPCRPSVGVESPLPQKKNTNNKALTLNGRLYTWYYSAVFEMSPVSISRRHRINCMNSSHCIWPTVWIDINVSRVVTRVSYFLNTYLGQDRSVMNKCSTIICVYSKLQ